MWGDEMTTLLPYQQLVVEEQLELDKKLNALSEFIWSDQYLEINDNQQYLLGLQSSFMRQYSEVLTKRILDFYDTAKAEGESE